MDFSKLAKKIYEMGEVWIYVGADTNSILERVPMTIGKVEEYVDAIEVLFENNEATYYIRKDTIKNVIYEDNKITVIYNFGCEVILENIN